MCGMWAAVTPGRGGCRANRPRKGLFGVVLGEGGARSAKVIAVGWLSLYLMMVAWQDGYGYHYICYHYHYDIVSP